MCGRYVIKADPNAVQQEFQLTSVPEFAPRYNVAPTQLAPVITNDAPHELAEFRWGLVPSWAKDIGMGSKMINARAETVEEKPAFRAAFKKRRCIIPTSGFYEWQKGLDGKTPMFIHLADREIFGLAGLWEIWREPEGGQEIRTYTIITTAANDFMRSIHDRMPLVLHRDDYAMWLGDTSTDALRNLLRPYDGGDMTAYAVSKRVNSPAAEGAELLQPA